MDTFIEISAGGETVRVNASGRGLFARGIEALSGWYSTPDAKVETTERQAGHGAHAVEDQMVLYSARTVTLDVAALAPPEELLSVMGRVNRMAGRVVRLRVCDLFADTYADGYITAEWDAERWAGSRTAAKTGTVTVVCPDPRRYATEAKTATLSPSTTGAGGLVFDSGGCMAWPVEFSGEFSGSNVCVLGNVGTSTAYPTISVSGDLPGGFTLTMPSGGQLAYADAVRWQPVVLDCLSRTASVNGVDVTRSLTSRGWPSVPSGGSLRLSLQASGNGACSVELRDTYI